MDRPIAEAPPHLSGVRVRIVSLVDRPGLDVLGDVDLVEDSVWQRAMDQLVFGTGGTAVVHLDLAGLGFIDVRGASRLVLAAERLLADGRRLVVHRPPKSLRRVLDILWPGTSAFSVEA